MKRSNGEGSLFYDEKRKRYVYRVSFTNEAGIIIRKAFTSTKSAKEAKEKGKEFLATLNSGIDMGKSIQSLNEWLIYWLENYKKYGTKAKTYERYLGLVNQYIKPYIGKFPIKDLTPAILQSHFVFLLKNGGKQKIGIAPRSVNAVRRLLISSFEEAVGLGYILKNPAQRTTSMKVEKAAMHIIRHEEGERLIKAALQRSRTAWLVIVLALGTGMRISEIYGLEWSNVNLQEKYLVVKKSVVTTNHGILVQDSTKTATSNRKIPLPEFVVRALRRYALWQKTLHIRLGSKFAASDFVLANEDGKPRSPNSFSAHDYKGLLRRAGIDTAVRFHDLRHTHATWLLEAGVHVKVVSERLGHANIRITLDTYAHVLKTMQEQAIGALNSMFAQTKKKDKQSKV